MSRTTSSQAVIDRTTRQIVAAGGQIVKVAPWGRRRLAYPIDRHREGSYHIILFEAPSDAIAELEHTLQITEEVIRHLVTRVERPVKAGRRDEGDEGDGGDEDDDLPPDDDEDGRGRRDRADRRVRERGGPGRHRLTEAHDGLLQGRCSSATWVATRRCATPRAAARSPSSASRSATASPTGRRRLGRRGHRLVPRQRLRRSRRARRRAAPQGQPVFVEGRFKTREFEGNDGQKRTSLDMTADNVISLRRARVATRRRRLRRRRRPALAAQPVAPPAAVAAAVAAGRVLPPTTPTSTTFPSDPGDLRPMPPVRPRSATTSTATAVAARSARSAPTRPSRSTTRKSTGSAATSRSGPRSSRAARPARAPAISASWRSRSSEPGTWPCSRTRRSTFAPDLRRRMASPGSPD